MLRQNTAETLVYIALDRDECITRGLAASNTSPSDIVSNNLKLVSFLQDICLMKDHKILRVGSSRQKNNTHGVDIINEYSGFATYGRIEDLEPPTEDSLLTQTIPNYQDDYSKFLIVLGHMMEIQELLKQPKYKNVTDVQYYFIDDKPEKLNAIMRALQNRADLVPKNLKTISLASYVHKNDEHPQQLINLFFNNNQEVDYLSEIANLRKQYKNLQNNYVFITKEDSLRAKGYRRSNYSIDLALSIESATAAKHLSTYRSNALRRSALVGLALGLAAIVALTIFFPPAIVLVAKFIGVTALTLPIKAGIAAAFVGIGTMIGGFSGGMYWLARRGTILQQELAQQQAGNIAPRLKGDLTTTAQLQDLHNIPLVVHSDNNISGRRRSLPLVVEVEVKPEAPANSSKHNLPSRRFSK